VRILPTFDFQIGLDDLAVLRVKWLVAPSVAGSSQYWQLAVVECSGILWSFWLQRLSCFGSWP